MSDIRKEKTLVSNLDVGMFVSELDRPWLGTPFMLEGLLIENEEQIATIASLCQHVFVDRTFSTGKYFLSQPKPEVTTKNEALNKSYPLSSKTPNFSKLGQNKTNHEKFSFFEVIKEIQAANQVSVSGNKMRFNIKSVENLTLPSIKNHIGNTPISFSTQIKSEFIELVNRLKNWGNQSKKAKATKLNNSSTQPPVTVGFGNTILEEKPPVEEEIAVIYPAFEKTQVATREFFEAIAKDQKIDLSKVDDALNEMVESIERNPDALIWLAKLKQTDDYSYNHALNVSVTLMALASFMSLPKKQIKDLGLAGLLQDIGKVKIPSALLQKEEEITEDELELLKKHVSYALELLEGTENISGTVILTVSQHHERIDGSGYPYQLSGKQISLTGQLAGLIDTYCALTTTKAYAKGVYNQVALEQIHALRDTKFSGRLIDQLVQFMGMYPVSSLVELNSGEIGVVVQQNSVRRLQPRVMILLNPDKSRNEYPATINLINSPLSPTGEPYRIIKGLPPDSYGLNVSNYFN